MQRLRFCLRVLAVAVAFPVLLVGLAAGAFWGRVTARGSFHGALRLGMSIMDWVYGIPVGYTYWERFLAPAMFDEIAVHHEE